MANKGQKSIKWKILENNYKKRGRKREIERKKEETISQTILGLAIDNSEVWFNRPLPNKDVLFLFIVFDNNNYKKKR